MKDLIPGWGDKSTRERLDEVFSRGMLGSVLVGASAGKVVEKALNIVLSETTALFFAWSIAFVLFVALFVYWDDLEDAARETTERGETGK